MGRKPTKPGAIPRFRARRQKSGKVHYYYDHGGKPRKETPLGSDYGLAIKKWAEIERANEIPPPAVVTFKYVGDAYLAEVVPEKAPRTQADMLRAAAAGTLRIHAGRVSIAGGYASVVTLRALRERGLIASVGATLTEDGREAIAFHRLA